MSVAHYDLLKWVADGCAPEVYLGTSHRVSASALHNRGLITVRGHGPSWSATVTADGTRRLAEETRRIEAIREREAAIAAERRLQAQAAERLQTQATELLEEVIAGGGRLDTEHRFTEPELQRIESALLSCGVLPEGEKLTHEPFRMDESLGFSVYLRPDFEARIRPTALTVPRQLRSPHPVVVAFQKRRANVSAKQIPRAARLLQALVTASLDAGWKVPTKRRSGAEFDLQINSKSASLEVTIHELDERGRSGLAFVEQQDYYRRSPGRQVANKYISGSGRLSLTLSRGWDRTATLERRDNPGTMLGEQLPELIRDLEIREAEAEWNREEHERRSEIREARWTEVRQAAFERLRYARNADQALAQVKRRLDAVALRDYGNEVERQVAVLPEPERTAAQDWVAWLRQHADSIDPLNGPLREVGSITGASHEELAPFMAGWSTHGPYPTR